jgi:DNA-binding PadR family transcriptional regulator
MVYPALTYLEEIGYATIEAEGNRKLYHITEAGQAHLDANRARADALFAQFDRVGERMDRVRRAMNSGAAGDEPFPADAASGSDELMQAVRELRRAMEDIWSSPRDEQLRIAQILEHATADIVGKSPRG